MMLTILAVVYGVVSWLATGWIVWRQQVLAKQLRQIAKDLTALDSDLRG